jgi:sortase A
MRRVLAWALCLLGVVLLLQGSRIYAKALVAQVLLRGAWQQARQGQTRPRPWPWADTWAVARLRSSSHDVDLIVLAGAAGSTTAFGPGHITGTTPPGAVGNIGIAAHRDTHFAFLEQVRQGERLWLELPDGRARAFSIDSMQVVHESDTSSLSEPVDALTLVTCYPFHAANPGGPWRYVVRARAI